VAATRDVNDALQARWAGFKIGERIPLAETARAHELVEHPVRRGGLCSRCEPVKRIWQMRLAREGDKDK
jgi:hypothetical protein